MNTMSSKTGAEASAAGPAPEQDSLKSRRSFKIGRFLVVQRSNSNMEEEDTLRPWGRRVLGAGCCGNKDEVNRPSSRPDDRRLAPETVRLPTILTSMEASSDLRKGKCSSTPQHHKEEDLGNDCKPGTSATAMAQRTKFSL